MCTMINISDEKIISFKTGINYNIKQRYICTSKNIAYLIKFSCGEQYIGETKETLRKRLNSHLCDIFHQDMKKSVSNSLCES